jgi:hypothetical protein
MVDEFELEQTVMLSYTRNILFDAIRAKDQQPAGFSSHAKDNTICH